MFNVNLESVFSQLRKGRTNSVLSWFYRKYFSLRDHSGVKVMEEDWDYLIILDACRYDVFEEVNWIEGDLKKEISQGSNSIEFLNKNFTDYYYNTVYVSANPWVSPQASENPYKEKDFISDDHFPYVNKVYLKDEYDEQGVSSPEGVTKEALKTHQEYPDSRMIVHYMQPHGPFTFEHKILEEANLEIAYYSDLTDKGFGWNEIREVYKANLERALESVEELIDELDGKIVITADHGEMLGEWKLHSHPHGLYFKELVEVPWLEVEK